MGKACTIVRLKLCQILSTCLCLQLCPLHVQVDRLVSNLLVFEALESISAFILSVLQPVTSKAGVGKLFMAYSSAPHSIPKYHHCPTTAVWHSQSTTVEKKCCCSSLVLEPALLPIHTFAAGLTPDACHEILCQQHPVVLLHTGRGSTKAQADVDPYAQQQSGGWLALGMMEHTCASNAEDAPPN